MPILDVEIVTDVTEGLEDGLAQKLADAAGDILDTPPGHTWVKLVALPRTQYAENGGAVPDDLKPVFVTVMKARRPITQTLQVEVEKLAQAFAKVCRRPKENVHILYVEDGAGRVAFGGRLVAA